jgi:hypothetical protein
MSKPSKSGQSLHEPVVDLVKTSTNVFWQYPQADSLKHILPYVYRDPTLRRLCEYLCFYFAVDFPAGSPEGESCGCRDRLCGLYPI